MRGDIGLQSKLGEGTTATFWIPFKKAPYQDDGSPLVDLASIPDRLQSDVSVSCGSSEDHTPPHTPMSANGTLRPQITSGSPQRAAIASLSAGIPEHLMSLTDAEREKIHILVVEDKYVKCPPIQNLVSKRLV